MYYSNMMIDQEKKTDLRLLLGHIVKFGGMGVKDDISLERIMSLPLIDNEYKTPPVRNVKEAMEVLNTLINGKA